MTLTPRSSSRNRGVLASDPGKQLDATIIGRVATLARIGTSTSVVVDDGNRDTDDPLSGGGHDARGASSTSSTSRARPAGVRARPSSPPGGTDDRAQHSEAEIFEAMYFSPANATATAVRPGPR
jgi:hypothetical protein